MTETEENKNGPNIIFHHNRINHSEAERRLRSSRIENSYLTRECRDKRGIFILSYMVNLSSIKHFIIPHKSKTKVKHQLNIDDLYTEVIAVTESIKECKFPLVPSVEESVFSEQEETSLYRALNETIDISLENVEWTEPLSWQK